MPIPAFNGDGLLPPFKGAQPTVAAARSPYRVTMEDVVDRFCTTSVRARLLRGLNAYRRHLLSGGFTSGTQWIDGSFVEDVETIRKRAPKDIDVVTLFHRPLRYQANPQGWDIDYKSFIHIQFFGGDEMKPAFSCDAYGIDLDAGPRSIVRNSTYWFGLFTDVRGSIAKKGIVEVALMTDPMEYDFIDACIGARFGV